MKMKFIFSFFWLETLAFLPLLLLFHDWLFLLKLFASMHRYQFFIEVLPIFINFVEELMKFSVLKIITIIFTIVFVWIKSIRVFLFLLFLLLVGPSDSLRFLFLNSWKRNIFPTYFFDVIIHTQRQVFSQLLVRLPSKFLVLSPWKIKKTVNWCFMGVCSDIVSIEVASSCCLFVRCNFVLARVVSKYVSSSWKKAWQESAFSVFLVHDGKLRSKEERIFSCWMTMNINQIQQLFPIFLLEFGHIINDACYFRKNKVRFSFVLTIKIFSSKTRSCIATNNSIRIKHRNDLENSFVSEPLRLCTLTC